MDESGHSRQSRSRRMSRRISITRLDLLQSGDREKPHVAGGETTEAPIEDSYTLTTEDGDLFKDDCPQNAHERRVERIQSKSRSWRHCPEFVTKLRFYCGLVVTDRQFKRFIIFLIVINSIMMGVATFDFVAENPDTAMVFSNLDMAFLFIFTIELAMNFAYHGLGLFRSGWLSFDFIVVIFSWIFPNFTVARSFRCLRLITHVKSLQDLVMALFNVMPRMGGVCLLLVLVFYVSAVMFTELFKDYYPTYTSDDYFGRLDKSLLTLFQIMTLDSWSVITKELMAGNVWAWVPMVVFVSISSFVFINLIIAVICDAVAELHHQEIEQDVIDHLDSKEFKAMAAAEAARDILRLEKKVDDLTELVGVLLRYQQQQQQPHLGYTTPRQNETSAPTILR